MIKDIWELYKLADKANYIDTTRTNQEVNFVAKLLTSRNVKSILDIGCGDGRIALPLATQEFNNLDLNYYSLNYTNDTSLNSKFDCIISIYSSLGYESSFTMKSFLSTIVKYLNPY